MDSEAWSGGRRGAGGLGGAAGDSRGRAALCGRLCPRLSVLSPHREGRRAAAFQLKCPFQTRRACPTHGLCVLRAWAGRPPLSGRLRLCQLDTGSCILHMLPGVSGHP